MEVTLDQVLEARERRAEAQRAMLTQTGAPVISFCMNIPGPVKNSPLIRRAFREGLSRLEDALAEQKKKVLHRALTDAVTGCEALLAVEGETKELKEICVDLEDEDDLGRLFDLDVVTAGESLSREDLGLPPRPCLICGAPGRGCASRRVHPVAELQAKTRALLTDYFWRKDRETMAAQAVRALLYEVCATPKPGLVDRANSGSHRDMDLFTFLDSAAALAPYFRQAAELGRSTREWAPAWAFSRLRRAGLAAERAMLSATGGVNTHKGAIFSLGTVCAAAGRMWTPERPWAGTEGILDMAARLCREAVAADFAAMDGLRPETAGARLYRETGCRGIRGELAAGLPSVREIGLPAMEAALAAGGSLEQAGLAALCALMARVEDTNLFARGGAAGQAWAAAQASQISGPIPDRTALEELDREMIRRNLSPGGCADLLAITYFLRFGPSMENPLPE